MKMHHLLRLCTAGLLVLILSACTAPDPSTTPKMEASTVGSLQPLHQHGTVWLGGQPTPEDFALLQKAGVKTVINLREPGEIDWDEGATVQQLGMTYQNPAFKAPETLTDPIFEQALASLKKADTEPALLHCKSANRVGAIWLAHRVLNDDLALEDALTEAKTVGLRSAEYEAISKDYIARNK